MKLYGTRTPTKDQPCILAPVVADISIIASKTDDVVLEENIFETIDISKDALDISVYPTIISQDNLLRIIANKETVADVEIYDLVGKNHFSGEVGIGNSESSMLIPNLSSGVYMISFKVDDFQKTFKIIK